jgi:enoyl-CoA hydratase/carnithine racemase
MTEPVLLVDRTGSVVIATLNRPDKGNALNTAMVEAIGNLVNQLEAGFAADDETRALVLVGAGERAFSAGADVNELDGIDSATARRQMRRGQAVFGALEALPIVVIAALNGFALGGGLELAMAADIRVASPAARLGQPEISLGNIPGWGGTQRLPQLIGVGKATELILTGEVISAQDALALGLVNRVSDDPLKAALDLANQIAERNPMAVRVAKQAIQVGVQAGLEPGLVVEAEGVAACCETAAQRAAVRAFLDRKK